MPKHIISLPVELLDQIIQHLEKPELSLLRQTCWAFRCAVIPKIFRRLEIDLTNELQLECLATAGTVSNQASVLHTKEVKAILGRDGKALSDAMSTISALKAVEQVELCFWAEGVSPDTDYWINTPVDSISPALASLPHLRGVHLTFPRESSGPPLPDLSGLHDLRSLVFDLHLTNSDWPSFLHSLSRALTNKPKLEELTLNTGMYGYSWEDIPKLSQLLQQPDISTLNLHTLSIDSWTINATSAELLLPHIRHLKTLTIGRQIRGDIESLWRALKHAKIHVQSLTADETATPGLMKYLRSYSGVQNLQLSPAVEDSSTINSLPLALIAHRATLQTLDITATYNLLWAYGSKLSPAIRKCTQLRELTIAATDRRTALILQDISSLSNLEVVKIHAAIGLHRCGTGAMGARARMTPLIRQQVREFVVPPESALRIVDTSGTVYRRRGSQLIEDTKPSPSESRPFVQSWGYPEVDRSDEDEETRREDVQPSSSSMVID
ncbi:hypothetical protein BDD12DRAFT_881978 [Trichophaea hybrida]|nr:hypothetical protein BDD12DRAFT_881978 [Trichophaea hybrida]